jgi:hypothetical protein
MSARLPAGARHDVLGTFPVPASEITAAEQMGIPPSLLARFFPRACDQIALSRSALYYDIPGAAPAVPLLWRALWTLGRHRDDPVGALRRAVTENLLNIYAATAYAAWEHDTRQALAYSPADEHPLDSLLDTATRLAAGLAGQPDRWDDEMPVTLPEGIPGQRRTFRELDSQAKIADELGYLLAHVLTPASNISAVACPAYGSMALALAARAVIPATLPGVTVHLIRLGFHDLAVERFLGRDGTVRAELTAPPGHRERLATAARGGRVLVIDDNVGYGTTLGAARKLIAQYGGLAFTRSTETAWHLYHRSGDHDIADVADLPSLRPNFHHRIQHRLISHLQRGDAAGYARDPAHSVRAELRQQMTGAYQLALSVGTWTPGHLERMRQELAFAQLHWTEPGVPPSDGAGIPQPRQVAPEAARSWR